MPSLIYSYEVPTRYDEVTLKVAVSTIVPQKIRIKVFDKELANTVFTNRYKTVDGSYTFYVRMPVSGQKSIVNIYTEEDSIGQNELYSVDLDKISICELNKKLDVIDFSNPFIKSFINFSTRFCFNAGWMAADNYISDDKRFIIQYQNELTDENGMEVTTPARIDIVDGHIEVSRKQFVELTVPNRMAILLHEFSHYYLNKDVNNEIEADLNGLLIYLGLGYPRIEAFEVFANTFINAPTEENKERYEKIVKFIENFENYNIILYE
jgi:hypothetical protein